MNPCKECQCRYMSDKKAIDRLCSKCPHKCQGTKQVGIKK